MSGSLRGRLLLAAALGVSVALVVSGVAVYVLTQASTCHCGAPKPALDA